MAKKNPIRPIPLFAVPTAPEIGADVVVINDKYTYQGTVVSYGVRTTSESREVYHVLVRQFKLLRDVDQWESIHDVFEVA